jgi:hypothetical protein
MRSSKKRPHQHVNESTPLGEKRKVKALQTSFRACNRLYVTWHIQFDLIRIVDGCTSKYSSGEIRLRIEAICDYWSNCMTVLSICSVKTKVLSDYHTHLVKSNLQANRIYLRRVGIQDPSLMVSTTKDLDEPYRDLCELQPAYHCWHAMQPQKWHTTRELYPLIWHPPASIDWRSSSGHCGGQPTLNICTSQDVKPGVYILRHTVNITLRKRAITKIACENLSSASRPLALCDSAMTVIQAQLFSVWYRRLSDVVEQGWKARCCLWKPFWGSVRVVSNISVRTTKVSTPA